MPSMFMGDLMGKTAEEFLEAIKTGDYYVNVHTTEFPAGEIRGQIAHNDTEYDTDMMPAMPPMMMSAASFGKVLTALPVAIVAAAAAALA